MAYTRVIMNLVGARKRHETLDGKNYLVVPTVMLTEGVHEGSQGAYYYGREELAKDPVVWNMKPVVVQHPIMNGEGVSACDPAIIEQQSVGMLFNTGFDGRLKTEAWINEDKLRRIHNNTLDKINDGKMVEISTGLYHDPEPAQGEWNGEKYIGIVRNIRPDHLAILPDTKGACSIADGAGLLRNAAKDEGALTGPSMDDIRDQISKLLREDRRSGAGHYGDSFSYVCDVYPKFAIYECDGHCYKIGYKIKSGTVTLDGEPQEVRKVTSYVNQNGQRIGNEDHQGPLRTPSGTSLGPQYPQPNIGELSDINRKNQFERALQEHYSGVQQEGDWGGWVTDIFANYVVYSKDGKLFRLPYTYDDDKIRFDSDYSPEEVERVSEYRTRRQTPIDGTASPYNVNSQRDQDMANAPRGRAPTQNAIHQGTGDMIRDATQHEPHHAATDGKSDSQQRSDVAGARKEAVDKLISHHGWDEEQRKFLMDLPDDHFQKVQGYSLKGAKQPIVPYGYEGIGDRSNVHATTSGMGPQHNGQAPPPAVQNQDPTQAYIDAAPPAIRSVLVNAIANEQRRKIGLTKIIVANANNRFNEKWLLEQDVAFLEGLAVLARQSGPQQNQQYGGQGQPNYGGQGDTPMFNEGVQNLNSPDAAGYVDGDLLPIPTMDFTKTG